MSLTIDMTLGMYRRIYAAGIQWGDRINNVSPMAEMWFWRLHTVADDFGNFRANAALLKSAASPRRPFTVKQIDRWMKELAAAPLIVLYEHQGEQLAHILDFEEYQPAGKNGRRVQKHQPWPKRVNPGESRLFRGCRVESGSAQQQGQQQEQVHIQEQGHEHEQEHEQSTAPERAVGEFADLSASGSAAALAAAAKPTPLRRALPGTAADLTRALLLLGVTEPRLSEFKAIPNITAKFLNDLNRRKLAGKKSTGWAIRAIEDQFGVAKN